jgi:lactoylglutathione lyase
MKKLSRYFLVGMLVALYQSAYAQLSTPDKQPVISLNHIALHVNNLKKSADFYENVLQLKKIPEPFKDGLHEWFSLGAGAQLHLIGGASNKTEYNRNSHLCFSVSSIEDFISRLDKAAVPYNNWAGESKKITQRVDGVKQIYFQDPDGYWIEVNNHKG